MAQLAVLAGLQADTMVRLRPGLRLRLQVDAEQLRLRALDTTVTLEKQAESALKQVQSGEPFAAGQLAGLDSDAALDLSRRLLTAAVLVPGA